MGRISKIIEWWQEYEGVVVDGDDGDTFESHSKEF